MNKKPNAKEQALLDIMLETNKDVRILSGTPDRYHVNVQEVSRRMISIPQLQIFSI